MVTKLFKGKKLYHFVPYILKKLLDFKYVFLAVCKRGHNHVANYYLNPHFVAKMQKFKGVIKINAE